MRLRRAVLAVLLAFLGAGCTILRLDADEDPAQLRIGGLVDGHVAIGVPVEDDVLDVEVFDGRSSGAVFELTVWKLLRLELGLAGADVGVGPLEVGLGVLAYDPEPWVERPGKEEERKRRPRGEGEEDEERPERPRVEVDVE